MRCYLIDPYEKTIEEVDREKGLDGYYKLLQCGTFDIARLQHHDDIYVNDNGLYEETAAFVAPGYLHPLFGRGIVASYDAGGNTTPPRESLAFYRERIRFLGAEDLRGLFVDELA